MGWGDIKSWVGRGASEVRGEVADIGKDIAGSVTDLGAGLDDLLHGDLSGAKDRLVSAGESLLDVQLGLIDDVLAPYTRPRIPAVPGRSVLANKQGNNNPIPIIYGSRRVGGSVVFIGVSGTNKEYLHIVMIVGEGEIQAINTVYLDDIDSADARFTGHVTITKYTGTDGQTADADLVSSFSEWTTNHRLRGLAYIHAKLKFNIDIFSRIPTITADVQGKKLYDTRTSTTAYSTNPALCIYDYLTNARYGKGLSASDIDITAINAAANTCETQITPYTAGATINQFACNTVLNTGNTILANLKTLLTSCRGWLPFVNGKYTLVIEKDETPGFTFDNTNIIGAVSITSSSKSTRYNRVNVQFDSPDKEWNTDTVIEESTTLRSTQDNNLVLESTVQMPCETSQYRAKFEGQMALKRSRQGISVALTATIAALNVRVGDVVYVTLPEFGWSSKKFRVGEMSLENTGNVGVTLVEHEPTVYDRTVGAADPTPPDTNLPNPYTVAAPTGLGLTSGTTELLQSGDGTIISRIKAAWAASADQSVEKYVLESKKTADSIWEPAGTIYGRTNVTAHISPVSDGIAYDVRVKAINSLGVVSAWATITNHTVVGKTAAPNPCSALAATGVSEGIRWDWTNPSDADLAEIWIYLAATNSRPGSPTYKLGKVNTYTQTLAAGTVRYAWVLAIDTSGNPSAHFPASATAGIQGTAGSVAYSVVSGTPTQLSQINSSEGTKLTGIESGADVTGLHTITLINNPSFEAGDIAWTKTSGWTIANEPANSRGGQWIAKHTGSTGGINRYISNTTVFPVQPGNIVVNQCWAKGNVSANGTFRCGIDWLDSSRAYISSSASTEVTITTSWQEAKITGIAPAGAAFAQIGASTPGTKTAGELYIDDFMVTIDKTTDALNSGVTTTGYIILDANGNIRSGKTGFADYTNLGFIIGKDGSTSKFLIGDNNASVEMKSGEILAKTLKTSTSGKRVELNPAGDNELHFYGDRGDATIEELATIGIRQDGSDYYVATFGSADSTRYAIKATSIGGGTIIAINSNSPGNGSSAISAVSQGYGDTSCAVKASTMQSGVGVWAKVYGASNYNNYAIWADHPLRPIKLTPLSVAGLPSHQADKGTLCVDSSGVLYINTSGSTTWQKVGAQ